MRAIYLLVILVAAQFCLADGKFMFRGDPKTPDQPYQRAILKFRNGEETLVIESMVTARQPEIAWLLPIPSKPKSVEAVTHGTIETLATVMGPHWYQESSGVVLGFGWLALVLMAMCMRSVRKFPDHPRPFVRALFEALVVVGLTGIAAAIFFPVFAGAGPRKSLLTPILVGSYEMTPVEGGSALTQLENLGFSLSGKSQAVLTEQVKKGWTILAFKLRADKTGVIAPHPLKIVFEVPKPIYPMRLTMADGGDVTLDLFVLADSWATVPNMNVWATRFPENVPTSSPDEGFEVPNSRWTPTNHQGVANLFWEGCKLTRLHGTFVSANQPDVAPLLTKQEPVTVSLMPRGDLAWVGIGVLILWVSISGILASREGIRAKSKDPVFTRQGLALSACVAIGVSALYLSRFELADVGNRTSRYSMYEDVRNSTEIVKMLSENRDLTSIDQRKKGVISEVFSNNQVPPKEKDVPGGFWIEDLGDIYRLTVYNRHGDPTWIDVSKDPAPK